MRRIAVLLAFGWSVATFLYLLSAPVYAGVSSTVTAARHGSTNHLPVVSTLSNLVEVNGPGVLAPLALPVGLSLLAVLAAFVTAGRVSSRAVAITGIAAALFCLLGAMTVGLFYAPVALLLLGAAALPERLRFSPP